MKLLFKEKLLLSQLDKSIISNVTNCCCNLGIIICQGCNGEKSKLGKCAGCYDSGVRTCGKCGGFNDS